MTSKRKASRFNNRGDILPLEGLQPLLSPPVLVNRPAPLESIAATMAHALERAKRGLQHKPFSMEGVTVFNEHRNLVFALNESPGLIFKTRLWQDAEELACAVEERMQNAALCRGVIELLKLDRLYLPESELIHVPLLGKSRAVIAQEELPIGHRESLIAEDFELLCIKRDGPFLEAVKQLARLILHTGFSDIEFRNIPPLRHYHQHFQLAIIDPEHMTSLVLGLAGNGEDSRGLLQCLSPELARELVESLQDLVDLDRGEIQRALEAREKEWERTIALRAFHGQRGICGNEPLAASATHLPIPDEDRDALGLFLDLLNAKLERADPQETVAEQRHLFLSWYEIREHLPRFGGREAARERIPAFLRLLRQEGIIFDVTPVPTASFWIQV